MKKLIAIIIALMLIFDGAGYCLRVPMDTDGKTYSKEHRALMYREEFEKLAKIYGGKGAWYKILERLAKKIGFEVAESEYMDIEIAWARFVNYNRELINEGNLLVKSVLKEKSGISVDASMKIGAIINHLEMPPSITMLTRRIAMKIRGRIISRSSGSWEDNYKQNLAGVFISEKDNNSDLTPDSIMKIFRQAIKVMWLDQYYKKIKGLPSEATEEEGIGILMQDFLSFDASGTAMTNYYGHTSIEAVFGDASVAVDDSEGGANIVQFLFEKGGNPYSCNYSPSFLDMPDRFILKGREYRKDKDAGDMEKIIKGYPAPYFPLNSKQVVELNRVANALEDEIGISLDIEWGFLDNKLYIVQIRPIIGDFKKSPVEISDELKNNKRLLAETPIVLGNAGTDGFKGKVVFFERWVDKDTIEEFEDSHRNEYIRVQYDVAAFVSGQKQTKAKVLVDLFHGSRQAHAIDEINDRIANGEFAYASGTVLQGGLSIEMDNGQQLLFKEYEESGGVWVSTHDVIYFSDGIKRGYFFFADDSFEGHDLGPQPLEQVITKERENIKKRMIAEDRKLEKEQVKSKPEFPEKLKILFVHDNAAIIDAVKIIFPNSLHLDEKEAGHYIGEEYELFFVDNQKAAIDILRQGSIDYVMTDWMLHGIAADSVLRAANTKGINFIGIYSGDPDYVKIAKRMYPFLDIHNARLDETEEIELIQAIRQKQIQLYKEALAKWNIEHPESAGKQEAIDASL